MTLTIGMRWRLTVQVQPLTHMTRPKPARLAVKPRTGPDLAAIAQANTLRAGVEERRNAWEMEALFCSRRVF